MPKTSWDNALGNLAILAGFLFAIWAGAFDAWEAKALDQRFRIRGKAPISPDLVLVDISNDAIEEFGPWPIPRHLHGMFIDAAANLGARSIVYDINFSRASDARSDGFLREMIRAAGNVYFPLGLSPYEESYKPDSVQTPGLARHSLAPTPADSSSISMSGLLSVPIPGLDSAARGMGFVNVVHDDDGVVRRTPLRMRCNAWVFPQLVMPVWEEKVGRQVPPSSLDATGSMLIDWPGTWQDLPHWSFRDILVSYKQVMEGTDPVIPIDTLRKLKGKILLVGHVDPSSQEFIATPLDGRFPTTGLHFAILNTLLTDGAIRTLHRWQEMVLAACLLLVAMVFLRQESSLWQIATGALFAAHLAGSQWLFASHHLHLPTVSVGVSLAVLLASHNISNYRRERRNRDRVKSIFAKYVTKEVMDQLLERPELVELGGRKEIVSILFADIRGFTSLSETLEPHEIVSQLNEYLSAMTPIIFANQGIIDKFVGDEIMAYFGAPVNPEDHSWRAVKTAIEMQEALVSLRARWKANGRPDIRIGIGVNTGSVIMGNIGSSQYMDFTLIGDAVNLGARLCSIAAPGEILISPSCHEKVRGRVAVLKSTETPVKGRAHTVTVHSISTIHPVDESMH